MRDCYFEQDTVFGDFDRIRDITQIDLVGHEKHQAYRLSSIQEEIGLLSDTSRRTSIREKFRRSNFKEQQENSGKQDEEEDGILEYDSPSDDDDIPSLEREADFLPRKRSPLQKNCSLQQQSCVQLIFVNLRCYGTMGLRDLLCLMHLLKLLFVSLILIYLYLYVCP